MSEMSRTFNFDEFDQLIAEGLQEYDEFISSLGERPDVEAIRESIGSTAVQLTLEFD